MALYNWRYSNEAIPRYSLVKPSASVAGRVEVFKVGDSATLATGVALTRAAGAGVRIRVLELEGVETYLLSDGTTTIAPQDRVEPSEVLDGYVRKGNTAIVGVAVGAAAATVGALVAALPHRNSGAAQAADTYTPPNCLYFPTIAEGGPTHVDFGSVYAANTQFGQFFFEAWLRWDSGQYFVSDGYGGGHALLIGVTPGTGTVAGNFWDSGSIQSFASEDVVVPGEWFHAAVGYNGVAIEVYINGVPCGRKAYTGQRWSSIANWYVGGSDHQNFYGAIATMRLFEGYCPTTRASFRPDRFVGTKFGLIDAYGSIKWMADFTKPATIIADHGVTGGHPGRLCNATTIDSTGLPLYADPVPYWIYDPNCPVQTPSPDPSLWGAAALTPPSTPANARFFDSFSRADQTRATPAADYVGLGTGEATGTLGALTWTDPGSYFGIFKGRVFIVNLAQRVLAYVENGLADMDVSVDRNGAVGDVGLVLRLVNSTNYVKVWYHNSIPLGNGGDNHIRVSVVVNGVVTADVVNAVPTASFTTLRCKVKTVLGVSTYSVYTNGNLIGTGTDETHLTATKCGIYTEWYTSSTYANAHGRMDNFTIYATP